MPDQADIAMQDLKTKYPAYKDVPADKLAKAIVEKYPVYEKVFSKFLSPASSSPAPYQMPTPPAAPTREQLDAYRMKYFNTLDERNAPFQTANALAKDPSDAKALARIAKMKPVSQAAIWEKVNEINQSPHYDSTPSGTMGTFGQSPIYRNADNSRASYDMGLGIKGSAPLPHEIIGTMLHGPEGYRKMQSPQGNVAKDAITEVEKFAESSLDPENLAFLGAAKAIGSMSTALKVGKIALKGSTVVKGAITATMAKSAVQNARSGNIGAAIVDTAAAALPHVVEPLGKRAEAAKSAKASASAPPPTPAAPARAAEPTAPAEPESPSSLKQPSTYNTQYADNLREAISEADRLGLTKQAEILRAQLAKHALNPIERNTFSIVPEKIEREAQRSKENVSHGSQGAAKDAARGALDSDADAVRAGRSKASADTNAGTPESESVPPNRSSPQSASDQAPDGTTRAQNSNVNARREQYGMEPLRPHIPKSDAELHAQVVAGRMEDNALPIAQEILKNPRSMTDAETLANDYAQNKLGKEIESGYDAIIKAADRGEDVSALMDKHNQNLRDFETLTDATKRAGTEQGRALRSRQIVVDDYSVAATLKRMRLSNPALPLTPEEADAAATASINLAEHQKVVEAHEAKLPHTDEEHSVAAAEQVVEGMKTKGQRAGKTQVRQDLRARLDTEHEKLRDEFLRNNAKASAGFDPANVNILRKIAANRVKVGLITLDELVDHVHGIVKERFPAATKREVRDAISGYGYPTLAQKVSRLAALKQEARKKSRAEDIEAGIMPPPDMKAAKTRMLNEIKELQRQIDAGEPDPPKKKTDIQSKLDEEGQEIYAERDRLRRAREALIRSRLPLPSKAQQRVAYWKTGLLTSPRTIAKVVTSHTMSLGADEIASIPSAIADAALGTKTGKRSLSGISPAQVASSVRQAATQGVVESLKIVRHGEENADIQHLGKTSKEAFYGTPKTKSKAGQFYMDITANTHAAAYRTARLYAFVRSIQAEANMAARGEGLTGEAFKARVTDLTNNPTETMSANAAYAAEKAVFLNENAMTQATARFKSSLTPAQKAVTDFLFPFQKVSSNIALKYYQMLPGPDMIAGIVRAVGESNKDGGLSLAEQKRFSETVGRQVTGAGLMTLGALLAKKGLMTGYGKRNDGKPEGAVKIGGRYFQLTQLAPVGPIMAVGASLFDHPDKQTPFYKAVIKGGAENPVTSTAETVSGIMDKDPTAAIGNLAGSVVPQGIADLAAQMDDRSRKAKTVGDYVKQRIPLVRQQVPVGKGPKVNKLFDPTNSVPSRR